MGYLISETTKEEREQIVKDSLGNIEASPMDGQVVEDLLDALKAHEDGCVGMAANMRE